MIRARSFLVVFGVLFFTASNSLAQFPVISAQDVKSWMQGKRKAVLVDTRPTEEYQAGHIPGAINIPADRISAEAARLPRDKSVPVIFYCRGAG